MAKLQLGNKPMNHGGGPWEPPAESNVRQFLSRYTRDFQQSKSDQLLRFLHDQDTLTKRLTDCGIKQRGQRPQVPQRINGLVERDDDEDTLVSDADTNSENSLTVTSSSSSLSEKEEVKMERRPLNRQAGGRSKTSVGFYNDIVNQDGADGKTPDAHDDSRMDDEPPERSDTRFNRPKSSYVRRRYRNTETFDDGASGNDDTSDSHVLRPSRSARPRSRLGNRPIPADTFRRKIPLTEVNGNHSIRPEEESQMTVVPNRDELLHNGATSVDRHVSKNAPVPAPRFRKDKSNVRAFCDEPSGHDMADGVSPVVSMDIQEEITVIQTKSMNDSKQAPHITGVPYPTQSTLPAQQPNSMQQQHQQHQHQPQQYQIHQQQVQQVHHQQQQAQQQVQQQTHTQKHQHLQQSHQQHQTAHGGHSQYPQHQQHHHNQHHPHQHGRAEQSSSNQNHHSRPKNPEPIMSRPLGRAEMRPNTRRRLERRYMQQNQKNPLSSARPTSESVILARQKTEKNLLKAQAANDRPKSERILLGSANKMLSVARNPAQGPQTIMNSSKNDVAQASHVHPTGFRGYDPGSRVKDPNRRELHGDVNLQPRGTPGNVIVPNRRPLTLMKLPPLEASMAKKSERGISIARETCV